LLHRNLVDVRQSLGSGCAFDRLQRDLLHLLLRLIKLLLQRSDLRRLSGDGFLQTLDPQIGYAFIGLSIFSQYQKLLFELHLGCFGSLRRGLLGFAPQARRKFLGLFAQPRQLFFPLLQLRF
jgi:hypothetical protein